jgi:hypothetical protein
MPAALHMCRRQKPMMRDFATKSPVVVEVDLDNSFKLLTKVIVVHNSLRYHKLIAIEIQAREYRHVYDMFMSDEMCKRLNLD